MSKLRLLNGIGGTVAAGAIGPAELATSAVENVKLAPDAVTADKIADGTVVAAEIGPKAVITAKINDLAVTAAQLGAKAVETAKINDLAVTAAQLGALAVTKAKLFMKTVAVTVAMGAGSGSSAADADLVGGALVGIYPTANQDQFVQSVILNADGSITVTLVANATATNVFAVTVLAP